MARPVAQAVAALGTIDADRSRDAGCPFESRTETSRSRGDVVAGIAPRFVVGQCDHDHLLPVERTVRVRRSSISNGKNPGSAFSTPTRSAPDVCALAFATKKWPGDESPFDNVRTASTRAFSTRNSDAVWSADTIDSAIGVNASEHECSWRRVGVARRAPIPEAGRSSR